MRHGHHISRTANRHISFFTGNKLKSVNNPRDIDELVAAVNRNANLSVVRGGRNSVTLSQNDIVLTLKQSTGSGIVTQDFQIVSDGGDWYNCYLKNGTTIGTTVVKVAKEQEQMVLNPGLDPDGAYSVRSIRGVDYTYTYAEVPGATDDFVDVVEYTRGVVGSDGSSATSYITPFLDIADTITAYRRTFKSPATLIGVQWKIMNSPKWADKQS